MNRRERLMATLNGKPVDRPAVCFYEINGMTEDPNSTDPFHIYADPSWHPLIQLARDKTDRIVRKGVSIKDMPPDPIQTIITQEVRTEGKSRFTTRTVKIGKRTLTTRIRRDQDVNTNWTLEHLLKDTDDIKAYLDTPPPVFAGTPDTSPVLEAEEKLGDTGIVMIDMGDPLCKAAELFSMADYTVFAMTEPDLFHQLLQRFAAVIHPRAEAVAKALPGRLWRVVGSEYASPPYLPPALYKEYWADYARPMIQSIQKYGGFARVHSHGNLKDILDHMASTGCSGIDPIEPPPQGDVELSYVRKKYGKQLVLFGNLEVSDIEILPTAQFAEKIKKALTQGTAGKGRGFVLMPSACPYGRKLSPLAMANYEKMVELVENF